MPQMKKNTTVKKKESKEKTVHKQQERKITLLFFSKAFLATCTWFFLGIILGIFFLTSFAVIIFQFLYNNKIYPNISVANKAVGGQTKQEVITYFQKQNQKIGTTTFTFTYQDTAATMSAEEMQLGYNSELLAQQAYDMGRANDFLSNASLIAQTYLNGVKLPPAYSYSTEKVEQNLQSLIQKAHIEPVDAQFNVIDGKVTAFRPSTNGQDVDIDKLHAAIADKIPFLLAESHPLRFTLPLPVKSVSPKVTTDSINSMGIKELIGVGTSLYAHSIASRVYNIGLGASRINGTLVPPGKEFSFAKAVGDVSSLTGYKQAYVISGGHTVLGDGGGICQVSTTLFRAALNAGLKITERHAHDYRVGYYEEDAPPGIDATVYVPTVDLKFLNDTGHYILVQTINDPANMRLTFYLYGTKDGRQVTMTTPIVTNQTPPPPDLYQDDPTLPIGTIQQTDFAAWGADVSFKRTVVQNGQVIIQDTFTSHYRPWQAVYLRGTKA